MKRRRTEGHRQKKKTRPLASGEANSTAAAPAPLRAAKALWSRRQYAEALKKFGEAAREHRWNIGVLIDAARAYAARYQFEKSDALLARALKLGGKRHDVQFLVGQSYRMAGQFEQAAICFRRACQLAAAAPSAQLELATILEREHRLDEALQLIKRALHAQPQLASALVLKARLCRRLGEMDHAEQGLRKVVHLPNIQPALVAEAWGELALVYDQQANYAAAWQSILHCKQCLLPHAKAEQRTARHVMQRFGQMIDTINKADFQRWQRQARQQEQAGEIEPRRVAMLTGFPRSGTTLLEQILDSHPQIVSAEEQEVMSTEVFANVARDFPADAPVQDVLHQLTAEQIRQQRGLYFEMMEAILRQPLCDRVLLDKNPAMTPMIPVLTRLLPEIKLLIALRDPRDVVLSCFLRYLPLNPVSVSFLTLEDAARRYAMDMRGWLRFRELISTPWHEVRYERLINDLPGQSQQAVEFLNLPWHDEVLRYREHSEKKHVLSPTYDAVAEPVFATSVGRWRNYAEYLEPLLNDLAPFVDELEYD